MVSVTWLGLKVNTSVEWELRFALSTRLWFMVLLVKYYMFSSKYKLQRPNVNDVLLLHQTPEIEEQIAFSKNKQEAHRKTNCKLLKITEIVSMIRKYHDQKLQLNPWHHEEEPHNNHETPRRQTKQSNQLSHHHQDDCKTGMDIG